MGSRLVPPPATVRAAAASLSAGTVTARQLLSSAVARLAGPLRPLNAFVGVGPALGYLLFREFVELSVDPFDPVVIESACRFQYLNCDIFLPSRARPSVEGVLPRAESDADASDARRRFDDGGGTSIGALSSLDGVPIAVKDNFCVAGAPTTAVGRRGAGGGGMRFGGGHPSTIHRTRERTSNLRPIRFQHLDIYPSLRRVRSSPLDENAASF